MTRAELLAEAKPILFNPEMVRAILDGSKTVTRRVVKPRYRDDEVGFNIITNAVDGSFNRIVKYDEWENDFDNKGNERIVNPPYNVGNILYVRETWALQQGIYWHKAGLEIDENGREPHGTIVPKKMASLNPYAKRSSAYLPASDRSES